MDLKSMWTVGYPLCCSLHVYPDISIPNVVLQQTSVGICVHNIYNDYGVYCNMG